MSGDVAAIADLGRAVDDDVGANGDFSPNLAVAADDGAGVDGCGHERV